ncbi:MAG: phosphatidate cytidylyltransferase [Planctomycetaceae bacterium]
MLRWRLLMSCVLVPATIALFIADQTLGRTASLFALFCGLVSLRSAWELCDLLAVRSIRPSFAAAGPLAMLVTLFAWIHLHLHLDTRVTLLHSLGCIAAAFTAAALLLLTLEAVRFDSPGVSMESLGGHLVILFYAGLLPAVTAQLRWFPREELGYFALASMIICVKCGDTCAYTFGRLWGKRRLTPKLSPGKTGMGFIGALIGSTTGGWLWFRFAGALFDAAPQPSALPIIIAYGLTIGAAGVIGDLCESLIKRDVGKKDASALMPGFGGLLDLVDSPLYAGPIALAWWTLLPPAF